MRARRLQLSLMLAACWSALPATTTDASTRGPTCTVTSPVEGATVGARTGSQTATITASAPGAGSVHFYANGKYLGLGEANSSGVWTYHRYHQSDPGWDTTEEPNGTYAIGCAATVANATPGPHGVPVRVTVSNPQGCSVLTPSPGERVSGTSVALDASAPSTASSVRLYLHGSSGDRDIPLTDTNPLFATWGGNQVTGTWATPRQWLYGTYSPSAKSVSYGWDSTLATNGRVSLSCAATVSRTDPSGATTTTVETSPAVPFTIANPTRSCGGNCARRAPERGNQARVMGCAGRVPQARGPGRCLSGGAVRPAVMTADGTNPGGSPARYSYFSRSRGSVTVRATAANGGSLRMIFWPTASPASVNGQSCTTISYVDGLGQPGVALRIAEPTPGGYSAIAVMPTIYFAVGLFQIVGFHTGPLGKFSGDLQAGSAVVTRMSRTAYLRPGDAIMGNGIATTDGSGQPFSTTVKSIDSSTQITMTHPATATITGDALSNGDLSVYRFDDPHLYFVGYPYPYPWHVCARVLGSQLQYVIWRAGESPPPWGDRIHGRSIALTPAYEGAGHAGWYIGHLDGQDGALESAVFSDMQTTSYRG